jgi:hypothetical protein
LLTGRERVIRALCHEEPDRVPYGGEGISNPTADVILGRPCVLEMAGELRRMELWSMGRNEELRRRMLEDAHEIAKKAKIDFYRLPGLGPADDSPGPKMVGPSSWTFDGRTIYEFIPNSAEIKGSSFGEYSVKTVEDFEDYVKGLEERTDDEIDTSLERTQEYRGLMRQFTEELQIAVYGHGAAGFMFDNRWLPALIKCCYVRPDLVRRYEAQEIRRGIKQGTLEAELGCDVIYIGTDIAYNHGPIVSPKHYHDLIMPYMRMQTDHFHKLGAFVMISSDGNLWPIIDDYLIGTGVDAQREIQTNLMDRYRLKERFGDRICFVGNVDTQWVLPFGSTEVVIEETKDCIKALSPGGGHILMSSNSINQAVKPENFFTMLRTKDRYGIYNGY